MNYLAHIFLSGSDGWLQVGGFTADAIKGKDWQHYPKRMREGVLRHRSIDYYTDNHPVFLELKRELTPLCGRYAGIVLDIYFDYLLASNFSCYTTESLRHFTLKFYFSALTRYFWLPKRIKGFIFHFVATDRLMKYKSLEGIKESLDIMVYYRELPIETKSVIGFLRDNEDHFRANFHRFFVELQSHVDTIGLNNE